MKAIFPGMDPYLEHERYWNGFAGGMAVYLAEQLNGALRPRYIARTSARFFVEQPRGLEVSEPYVKVLDKDRESGTVCLITFISPFNKKPGPGRDSYLAHRREILSQSIHLVEIDLLRTGQDVAWFDAEALRKERHFDYAVCVHRAGAKNLEVYTTTVRHRLPRFRLPLGADGRDHVVDLQSVLEHEYHAGCYACDAGYDRPCDPPLSPDDQAWANELIQRAKQ